MFLAPSVGKFFERLTKQWPVSGKFITKTFDSMATLERIISPMLGPWTLLIMTSAVLSITFSTFQGLVFGEWVTSILAVTIIFLLKPLFRTYSTLYETCVQVMESWTPLEGSAAFSRWRRCRKPLRVTIGAFFYFDRGILLTFADIILSNTVSLMLSYREPT